MGLFVVIAALVYFFQAKQSLETRREQVIQNILYSLKLSRANLVNAILLDNNRKLSETLKDIQLQHQLEVLSHAREGHSKLQHVVGENASYDFSGNTLYVHYNLESHLSGLGYLFLAYPLQLRKDYLTPLMTPTLIFFLFTSLYLLLIVLTYRSLNKDIISRTQSIIEKLQNNFRQILLQSPGRVSPLEEAEFTEFHDLTIQLNRIQSELEKNLREKRDLARREAMYNAVAETTQMLAHDVRKPFSQLSMSLEVLRKANTPGLIKEFVPSIITTVEYSMRQVDSMLDDVMEIGRISKPDTSPASISSLLDIALENVIQLYPESDIHFYYDFKHTNLLQIDKMKILRVLTNIIENAVQAMQQKGALWFSSESYTQDDTQWIAFKIKNNNSYISKDYMGKLFEPFFTKGKLKGTGLGLAIAEKHVRAHGGNLKCESSEEKEEVCFTLTLPLSKEQAVLSEKHLPENSQIITRKELEPTTRTSESTAGSGIDNQSAENILAEYTQTHGRKLNVAVVDDESIYLESFRQMVQQSGPLANSINLKCYASGEALLKDYKESKLDSIVCDVDLGKRAINGYEIVSTLKEKAFQGSVCIHSNRSFPEDYQRAVEIGAEAFILKPMNDVHLIRFLATSLLKTSGNELPTTQH